jgi:predicted metal-dependent hydrolase
MSQASHFERITVKRSKRRTMQLEIDQMGNIILRCPLFCSAEQVNAFVTKHTKRIERKLQKQKKLRPLDQKETDKLLQMAKEYLPGRLRHWASVMGLEPQGLTITRAKTRYGSCSVKGRISLSCYLMQSAEEAIDYVLVHELCHLKYLNHGQGFHTMLEGFLPDWRERKKRLCPPSFAAI